jgi:hypothetical protein
VLVIRDTPAAAVPGQDDNLFDDWRLPLTAELKKRFKADVAQRLPAEAQPSAAQWKLIFSDTPSTCVVAGAGQASPPRWCCASCCCAITWASSWMR